MTTREWRDNVWWCIRGNGLCKPDNRISTIVFHTKGGTAEADGAGGGWQSSDKTEKQQHSEAYSFHADNPPESRLTPEPPALSVAGPFSSLPIRKNLPTNWSTKHSTSFVLSPTRFPILHFVLFLFFTSSLTLLTSLPWLLNWLGIKLEACQSLGSGSFTCCVIIYYNIILLSYNIVLL